jgi:Protein of unknown function (DUF2637)
MRIMGRHSPPADWLRNLAARFRRPAKPPAVLPSRNRVLAVLALPVAVVAVVAGAVSYNHITALGLRTYQGGADAHLLAVPIDGLIVAGSVLLAAGSMLGWLGVALGVAATLFANLQFGLPHGPLSAAVSTWPAVAFTVACFMLERWIRSRRGQVPATQNEPAMAPVPHDALDAAIQAMIVTHMAGNGHSARSLAMRFELPPKLAGKVRQLVLSEANGHAPKELDAGSRT